MHFWSYVLNFSYSKVIKLFIIDQQSLFRQGIRSSLSQLRDIEVAGEADVGDQVLSIIESLPPDVVLLGVDAAPLNGLKLCRMIKQRVPSVSIIILSPEPGDEQVFQAIKAQASAYLSKTVAVEDLEETIRRCAYGEHPINESLSNRPKVAEQILQQFRELSEEREAVTFISRSHLEKQKFSTIWLKATSISRSLTS